jgi:hypothetical protein
VTWPLHKAMGAAMPKQSIRDPALTVLTGEPGLSLAAKGLATYVLARPPRVITRGELFRSNRDGMPFIDAAIRELVAVGLVDTVPQKHRGDRQSGGIILRTPDAQAG